MAQQAHNLQIKRNKAIKNLPRAIAINMVFLALITLSFITDGVVKSISVIGLILMALLFVGNFRELKATWTSGIYIKR